jgi:hypothetical protein
MTEKRAEIDELLNGVVSERDLGRTGKLRRRLRVGLVQTPGEQASRRIVAGR